MARKTLKVEKAILKSCKYTCLSTKYRLFQPPRLKTDGGDTFLVANDDLSEGSIENRTWASLLAVGPMAL